MIKLLVKGSRPLEREVLFSLEERAGRINIIASAPEGSHQVIARIAPVGRFERFRIETIPLNPSMLDILGIKANEAVGLVPHIEVAKENY